MEMKIVGFEHMFPTHGIEPEPNIDNAEARKASIQRCVRSLAHSCACRDFGCQLDYCQTMKDFVSHFNICKGEPNCCSIRKQIIGLCCYHSKDCIEAKCSFPLCDRIKQKVRDEQARSALSSFSSGRPPGPVEEASITCSITPCPTPIQGPSTVAHTSRAGQSSTYSHEDIEHNYAVKSESRQHYLANQVRLTRLKITRRNSKVAPISGSCQNSIDQVLQPSYPQPRMPFHCKKDGPQQHLPKQETNILRMASHGGMNYLVTRQYGVRKRMVSPAYLAHASKQARPEEHSPRIHCQIRQPNSDSAMQHRTEHQLQNLPIADIAASGAGLEDHSDKNVVHAIEHGNDDGVNPIWQIRRSELSNTTCCDSPNHPGPGLHEFLVPSNPAPRRRPLAKPKNISNVKPDRLATLDSNEHEMNHSTRIRQKPSLNIGRATDRLHMPPTGNVNALHHLIRQNMQYRNRPNRPIISCNVM